MKLEWILPVLLFVISNDAKLILNDTFDNLSNWFDDYDGYTGNITLVALNPTKNIVYTNISHCPDGSCFRAELATNYNLRSQYFANCSVEYWLGLSTMIPSSWESYVDSKEDYLIYNFQLHGGDNEGQSPNLGIRVNSGRMTADVCGNSKFNSSEAFCTYYDLGKPLLGNWTDWVIHSKLHYGGPEGFIQIWRNNKLMVDAVNVWTAFNDSKPPYMKIGSYVVNWKNKETTGFPWTASMYKALRLGNANSDYYEVYTGDGALCGEYCNPLNSDDDDNSNYFHSYQAWIYWVGVPAGIVIILSLMLHYASGDSKFVYDNDRQSMESNSKLRSSETNMLNILEQGMNYEHPQKPELNDHSRSMKNTHSVRFNLSHSIRSTAYSFGRYLINEEPGDSGWAHRELGAFRDASFGRTLFWYVFGGFVVLVMMTIAIVLYGGPFRSTNGLLPWKHLQDWNALQVTIVSISVALILIYFLPLTYIRHDFVAGRKFKNDPKFLRRIGVIIPCHKSAKEIGEVVRRVLKYIPPQNVVVCDNGNFTWPADNTFEVLKAVHPKIRYCFIKQGHKTRALWTGVHRLPSHVEYIIHLDDDTHFSDHMVFDESHFLNDKKVIAVAFLRSCYPENLVTQFTDFWYKITDHFHATQAHIATRCFVPGPAGLWKRDKFMEIFGLHPSLPFGEDIFGGFTTLNKGYAIRTERRCMVKTFAPSILLPCSVSMNNLRVQGYGASSLWKQRAHRWTVSALRITGKSLYSFFTYNTEKGIASNIAFRLYRFREYKIILVQLLYIPFFLVIIARGFYVEFFILKVLLIILPLLRNLFINYYCWRGQPELQVDLRTVLLSPFFNFFLIVCAVHGRWKCLLWYLPNVPPNHGMLQRLRPHPLKEVPTHEYKVDCKPASTTEINKEAGESTQSPLQAQQSTTTTDVQYELEEGDENQEEEEEPLASIQVSNLDAEKILKRFPNSFEIFEKDGSSKIVNYYQ